MPLGLLSPPLSEEVFKVFSQNRNLSGCSALSSRSWTFQFRVVEVAVHVEVFKVLAQDRIQQQRTWSRSLILQLAEVFQILPGQGSTASSSSRLLDAADEGIQGVFRTFPRREKVRSWVRTQGRN